LTLRVIHPPTYPAERRYILDVILRDFLGLEYRTEVGAHHEVCITRQQYPSSKKLLLPDVLFRTQEDKWLTLASLPAQPLDLWNVAEEAIAATLVSPELPVIYGGKLATGSFYEASRKDTRLGIDIFGSAFFALTRYEEVVKSDRDTRERFPAKASLAYQEGFLSRPIVNEYTEVLWWALKRLWPDLRRKRRIFRMHLTHDVDRPVCATSLPRTLKGIAQDVTERRSLLLAKRRAASFVLNKRGKMDTDLCNTFEFIMDLSENQGLRSSFNFMTDRSAGIIDGNYSMADPWIRQLLRRIHKRGHEIGLHPSYMTFQNPSQIQREFDLLRRVAEAEGISQEKWGGRQHYLRWEAPVTWQAYEDAELNYDATLSFADHIGFRCGTCYEYPAFNLRSRTPLKLRERPLVIMECSALDKHYMNLPFDLAQEELGMLKENCRLFDGDFTLLWHNDRLVEHRERELYRYLIQL
jgi:hypothetical protein